MTNSNLASERLARLSARIVKTWEERAIKEVEAATHEHELALQNSLPAFLDSLVHALSTKIDRTQIRIKWDLDENTRISKNHGRERAESGRYTIDQLIFEYHILRQVICELMEEEAILSPVEREVIVCAVEQAVNDAATQFSDTFRDINEKFTNTLAHDLRGPITVAKMSAQLFLKRAPDPEQGLKIMTRIIASMDRLDVMIHDLLDASKLRTGSKLELAFEDCDLDPVLKQIVEEVNFTHGDRVNLITKGNTRGNWNENGLRRVIDNLLTNALKFSPPSTPISVEIKHTDSDVQISVHNSGKPIAAEEQAKLFQQFARTRNSEGKKGWGLGLTVVKGITEAHGGQARVKSSLEAGTTFTVTLPWKGHRPSPTSVSL
ncbi:MAG: HAMP domain-containing sensor histidine kinase [Bdellovibrionota bacterium]